MAENTVWWHQHLDEKKVVFWAHNAHIVNVPTYGTGTMGYHLREEFADKYAAMGFLFSRAPLLLMVWKEKNLQV